MKSYLALGDSYTIGESVLPIQNFPSQLTAMLRSAGYEFEDPRIIAKTGWTTDELEKGIDESGNQLPYKNEYALVTLLIGVNNQYRERTIDNYRKEFESLLLRAISFAGNDKKRVIVLSIPDWGITPFAEGRDRKKIAAEIDDYNKVNHEIASRYNIYYIDITPWTREAAENPSLLASDGLHPSADEYKRWAVRIFQHLSTSKVLST